MQHFLKIVGNGQRTARDLTHKEAESAFTLLMNGTASLSQIAAFMAILRIKEESVEELAAFTRVLRHHCQATHVDLPHLVDICVPYDGRSRHHSMIPLAALIAAAAGTQVALHGRLGQRTPPKFGVGIGDVLAEMGVPVTNSLGAAADLLRDESIGVAYVDVAQFAPALERFNEVRFEYGMRSFFNTIEKLINPFNAPNGIIGVFHGPVLERIAIAMQAQGYRRGLAVQGSEGAIDVLTSRRTPLIEFGMTGGLHSWTVDPDDFGWWDRSDDAEVSINAAANAALTRQLIEQAPITPAMMSFQRMALLTAALIIYVSGKEPTFGAALNAALSAFNRREIAQRLARWQAWAQANQSTVSIPASPSVEKSHVR